MLDTAAEPVEFPDDESIAFAESFLHLAQPQPFGSAATDLVLEDCRAASFGKCFSLECKVLILGGDAGVANQHEWTSACSQNSWICELIENSFYELYVRTEFAGV